MSLMQLTITLFLIIDSPGNMPVILSLIKKFSTSEQRKILLREMVAALLIMLLFVFAGNELLQALHITPAAVNITGGIVLSFIALQMLFPEEFALISSDPNEEPFIVPIAIPLIAGPSLLGTVLVLGASEEHSTSFILLAVFLAWFTSALFLIASPWFSTFLGERGQAVIEKIMGLVMGLIAIHMLVEGIRLYSNGS